MTERARLEIGEDRSLIVISSNDFVENLSLYVPLTYTLPEGIREFEVNGNAYFYMNGVNEKGLVGGSFDWRGCYFHSIFTIVVYKLDLFCIFVNLL